ncbi:MAG: hypothetical protein RBG13Loki_1063 [Promethearchaeota archaeon CR_4]|nr:MAG: hypothetical protein RBG13Loki_1063 [Candidatus Lokiarchaeota archaeon CR_4]
MKIAAENQGLQIKIRFSPREIGLNAIFEKKTGIHAQVILDFEQHIFFFVNAEHFRQAIGDHFQNLHVFSILFKKRVHIIKFSPNPINLMKYCFPSIQIGDPEVRIDGNQKEMTIFLDPSLKGIVRGTDGHYLQLLNQIFARLFNIKKVSIEII